MGGRRDCYNGEWGTSFRARKWRSLDPCGLACVSLSAGIHCFAIATIASHFLRHSSVGVVLFVVVFSPCTLMALWSLYMAWSSDPGAVPMVRFFTFVVVSFLPPFGEASGSKSCSFHFNSYSLRGPDPSITQGMFIIFVAMFIF